MNRVRQSNQFQMTTVLSEGEQEEQLTYDHRYLSEHLKPQFSYITSELQNEMPY